LKKICGSGMALVWQIVSFFTEKLMEVSIQSFSKIQVSSVIRIEPQGVKNKNFKPQVPKPYLNPPQTKTKKNYFLSLSPRIDLQK
jgi:hypothetical protein